MQDCEPFGTFRAYLKHLPVIERVYFFQIFIANVLWNFCCFALLPLGTLAVERALTLEVFELSEASIYIILNRPRRRSTSTHFTGLEPCINIKVVYLSFVYQMSNSEM